MLKEKEMDLPFKIDDHSDERGFSFSLNLCLENFHIVGIRPGKIRGDHVHDYPEVAIVLGGKDVAEVEVDDGVNKRVFIVNKDFYILYFPTSVRHKFKNIGDHDFYLVCFTYPK